MELSIKKTGILLLLLMGLTLLLANDYQVRIDKLKVKARISYIKEDYPEYCSRMLEISEIFQTYGVMDSSLVYGQTVFDLATEKELPEIKAQALNFMGSYYNYTGDMTLALEYFNESLQFGRQAGDSLFVSILYENIGKTYKDLSDYDLSIKYLLDAQGIRERNPEYPPRPAIYISLATVYSRVGDNNRTLSYLEQAEKILEANDIPLDFQQASLYNELGNYYAGLGDLNKAESFYHRVIYVSRELGWKLGLSTGFSNLADVYSQKRQPNRALEIHLQSLELDRSMDNIYGMIKDYIFIAEIFEQLDEFALATTYADSAYAIATEKQMATEIATTLSTLSRIDYDSRNYKKAYEHFYEYVAYKDSLENIEYKKYLSELTEKYQLESKELVISNQNAEKKLLRQRYLFLLAAFIVSMLIVIVIMILTHQNWLKNINQKLVLRQKLFRVQMNPHFIFNTMGAIQHYIHDNKSQLAIEYLGEYAQLMRLILVSSDSEVISLEQELAIVRMNLLLESLRFPDKFAYSIEIPDDLPAEDIFIPPMILQPLVENCIQHGFDQIGYKGRIVIRVTLDGKELEMTVTDNGTGLKSNNIFKKSHALEILNERLVTLKKLKKVDTELSIGSNTPNGTIIKIRIADFEKLLPEII
ncbi:MAG: tetratricopeptide repeat protein [Candidatus Zophobacter franzmannii]|nr:tetratricopeptide repeat protein [Candidatus Zophobacter franzmannii]